MDLKNCGACGKPCNSSNATVSCASSVCAITACTSPFADCNMDPADGCEANLMTDPNNCTQCGNYCNVPNGIGGCANGCVLKSCYPGFGDCNNNIADGCETVVTGDVKNCGACGKSCAPPPNATATCFGGMCAVAGCSMGFADCDNNPQNGCESMLSSDPRNCGVCGNGCPAPPNANPACAKDACTFSCKESLGDCDGNPMNGCETDTSGDANNCGKCGVRCSLPNAMSACVKSVCALGQCNPGFADCNKNPNDGCEVNLQSDGNNCGACGMACGNGLSCASGKCVNIVPCSQVALAWCLKKGWKLASGGGGALNGNLVCTNDGHSWMSNCDPCGIYNIIVWKTGSPERGCLQVNSYSTKAGFYYGAHNPCSCGDNLPTCGQWDMKGCIPD